MRLPADVTARDVVLICSLYQPDAKYLPLIFVAETAKDLKAHSVGLSGYKEEGTTTTPFDMVVRNDIDRYHLVEDVIDRVPGLGYRAAYLRQFVGEKLIAHKDYIARHGDDMPEVRDWKWTC